MPAAQSKGKSKTGSSSRDARRSRSRNTTPISSTSGVHQSVEPTTTSPSGMQSTLNHLGSPSSVFIEDIFNNGGHNAGIPSPEALHSMLEEVKNRFLPAQTTRSEANEKFMRHLMQRRKARLEHQHAEERADREAEERKHKLKKAKKREPDEDRPLAVGAHGVARQDGTDGKDASSTISSPISQPPPSATGTGNMENAASPSGSEESHQPEKAPAVPAYQTFGPDPTKFDDPTIYHIRDITDDTPENLKKEILGVARYPRSDLKDLTPGTPPDKDFSNPKPQTQVNASVFANYVEPYVRPLTEEDLSFLREKGDRHSPFAMPRRGPRHYKEIWADEDGAMAIDPPTEKLPPNEPRGSMDMMNDEIAETDAVAPGPLVSRLLSTFRSEGRTSSGEANGTANGEMEIDGEGGDSSSAPQQPATYIPESNQSVWKNAQTTKLDYSTMDERAMQELIHIGFLSTDDKPDYDGHFDDEVAARLRYLQDELRKQSIVNGARKSRLLELAQHRMAQQEYCAIEDDLNNQLNAAYLKRNRNLGKGKKNNKRPGGAGGGSHAVVQVGAGGSNTRGLGEEIRALMEKKERWTSVIGPVVDYGKAGIPKESVFDEETMKKLMEREQEGWNNEVEE